MAWIKKRGLSLILVILVMILALPVVATSAFAADEDYGLIFNVADGKFYLDINLDGLPAPGNEYTGQAGAWGWDSVTSTLALNGFNWTTSAPTALRILGNMTINLTGANSFISTYDGSVSDVESNGIYAVGESMVFYTLTIQGDGSLTAVGGLVNNDWSCGIQADDLEIKSGTVTATGGDVLGGLSIGIASWASITMTGGTVTATGGNSVTKGSGSWGLFGSVTIAGGKITAIGGNVSADETDSDGMYAYDLVITGGTVTAIGGDAEVSQGFNVHDNLNISGGTITAQGKTRAIAFYLGRMNLMLPAEYNWWSSKTLPYTPTGTGTASADAAYVYTFSDNFVKIANFYTLNVIAGAGGTVSGTVSGSYEEDTIISLTATADEGYHFVGWAVNGATIAGGNNTNPATFSMPAAAVTVTANFEKNPVPPEPNIPLTGDTSQNLLLWGGFMLSVLGGVILWRYHRRWIKL